MLECLKSTDNAHHLKGTDNTENRLKSTDNAENCLKSTDNASTLHQMISCEHSNQLINQAVLINR